MTPQRLLHRRAQHAETPFALSLPVLSAVEGSNHERGARFLSLGIK